MTQREKIIAKLNADGEITQVWAMHEYILRLSERIRELEALGWRFEKKYDEVNGKKTKTYRYILVEKPKKPTYDLEWHDGRPVRVLRMV